MLHLHILMRQLMRSSKQATLFALCVALSVATLTTLSGFARSVNRSLENDARRLQAADIIIRTYEALSKPLNAAVQELTRQGRVVPSRYYRFYSVVRRVDEGASLLSSLKVVDGNYPFYGKVRLRSGRPFSQVLGPGRIVVAPTVLDRLGVSVGDSLQVGYTSLTIADVVLAEPDRPLNLFALGPRVFISVHDLDALGLLEKGSRIRRVVLLKVITPGELDAITTALRRVADPQSESVETFRTARSGIKRFMDNFIFFLDLVGLLILMVSGAGIQGTLAAFLAEKQPTLAIMKSVGATGSYVMRHFMLLALILALAGTTVGVGAGLGLVYALTIALSAFLSPEMHLVLAGSGVAEGVGLGLTIVALFAFLPLYRLKETRPVMIFRRDVVRPSKRWPMLLSAALLGLFFFALVYWHMTDVRFGLYFLAAIAALIAAAFLLTRLSLGFLKRRPVRHLMLRQAVKGLFRQGNAVTPVVVTLTVSLGVIFAVYLIEQNLDETFVRAYPKDTPNLFFLDIQPNQRETFTRTVQQPVEFYPIIRARVTAINNRPIDRAQEHRRRGDNFGRVFNLTYRAHLLADERLISGKTLFRSDGSQPQVSILDQVVEMHQMAVGDTITFNIQGVPLTARIASIRTRTSKSLRPFFYFVFPETVLGKAPQTLFTALRVSPERISAVQNKVVAALPNVSAIDLSETLRVFAGVLQRLSSIIRLFSLISMAAGLLILVSTILATRAERIKESVFYKILGAKKRFVVGVFAMENLLIGLLSALLALGMAQLGTFLICKYNFEIGYHPFWWACIQMMAATLGGVTIIGMLASRSILNKKPVVYLREQPDG